MTHDELLSALDTYYDAVPRSSARVEDFGALTLFVQQGSGYPYYGRPKVTAGVTADTATAADVDAVRARQRELGVPEAFEWVAENAPSLRAAVEKSGLPVHEHPLMVLEPGAPTPEVPVADGYTVSVLGADDPSLPSAAAVPHLAFAESGTRVGVAGVTELSAAIAAQDGARLARTTGRIRDGLTALAAAVAADGLAHCAGQYNPVGATAEIVGVGTLPSARRKGLGYAVTAALVADARAHGVTTLFLSAGDEDVARIYARLGFRRVGTALIAEA